MKVLKSRVIMALCDKWFQDVFIHMQDICLAVVIVANLRKNEFQNYLHYSGRRNRDVGVGRLPLPMYLL